ncbi:MAG: ACT domain-containing protein [Clostridiaceae bacterium]|nr:ACT domain-containing protein [Clostridiaceae bacterium]
MDIMKLEQDFSICKVPDLSEVDLGDKFCFIGKTDEELSLVCLTDKVPGNATHRDDCWKAFRIQGELDFSLIGILSRISTLLAENRIGIFAISTYNTDYILTKAADFQNALEILKKAGFYEIVSV